MPPKSSKKSTTTSKKGGKKAAAEEPLETVFTKLAVEEEEDHGRVATGERE